MGQDFRNSLFTCVDLQNRHRTLRDLGSSLRAGGQLEFVDTVLEGRGLCGHNCSAHGVSLILVHTGQGRLLENSSQEAGGQAVSRAHRDVGDVPVLTGRSGQGEAHGLCGSASLCPKMSWSGMLASSITGLVAYERKQCIVEAAHIRPGASVSGSW